MRRLLVALTLTASLVDSGCTRRADERASASVGADAAPPGTNAVQAEMRLLHEAMRDSVTAIAFGRPAEIPERLHPVHAARERTEAALESGAYRLPKNADRLDAFRALDESFHDQLEKLVATAGSNDVEATASQLGVLIGTCNGCHVQFRP
jgi:hypothetical protein